MGRRILTNNFQNFFLFVLSLLGINYLHSIVDVARIDTSYVSGWILFICIICLTIYGLRRFALPFINMSISKWRSFHIIIGITALIAFLFHLKFDSPTGIFEIFLAILFIFITFCGIVGVYLQKTIPKKLSHNGSEFLYEEISLHKQKLRNEFEVLISNAAESGTLSLISSDVLEKLHSHFSVNPNFLILLFNQSRHALLLKRELTSLISSNSECKILASDILKLVDHKNRLDYSYSNQFILKYWKTLHAPLTGALLLLITLHILLVYSFRM